MVRKYKLCDGRIEDCPGEGAQVFLYVNPTEEEKRYLIDELKLDEHTLASALDPDELSRLEFEPEHLALIFKRPKSYTADDYLHFQVSSVGLFLFKDRLIVVLSDDTPVFEGKLFSRTAALPEVLLKLIYRSIFHFLEHLKVINLISDELEHEDQPGHGEPLPAQPLHPGEEPGLLPERHQLQRHAHREAQAQRGQDRLFGRRSWSCWTTSSSRTPSAYKQAEIYSNILAGLMDARASIVSNNLNVLMKTLNIITIGHHGADLRGVRLFHERARSPGQAALRLLDHHGAGRRGQPGLRPVGQAQEMVMEETPLFRLRALIVEDEAIVAMEIQDQLEAFGWEVCGIAASGAEAIRLAAAKRPDLIILDNTLNGPMTRR